MKFGKGGCIKKKLRFFPLPHTFYFADQYTT